MGRVDFLFAAKTLVQLQIADLEALAEIAHAAATQLAADNTCASPHLQQPIGLGADFLIHSTTKYIGGHTDVVDDAKVKKRAAGIQRHDGLPPTRCAECPA